MEKQQVVEIIRRELPEILQYDEPLRDWVVELTRPRYADKAETESRFERMLEQLKIDREKSDRRWDEHNRKADEDRAEQNRKWDEHNRKADEDRADQNRKWDEHNRKANEDRADQNRKWDEHNRKANEDRAEQNRKWEENHQVIKSMLARMDAQEQKHNASIGALGARWGIFSEASFRNGLKGILEQSFGVKVENVAEYDAEGKVFDRPDQVELDVIIHNGLVILCEIKSSFSRSDLLTFHRKTVFYQERHQRTVNRKLIISPMVDGKALELAGEYGIEVYSHALDVNSL